MHNSSLGGGNQHEEDSEMDCRVSARDRLDCGRWLHLSCSKCPKWWFVEQFPIDRRRTPVAVTAGLDISSRVNECEGGDYVDERSEMDCWVGARFRCGGGGELHIPLSERSKWWFFEQFPNDRRRSSLALNATALAK